MLCRMNWRIRCHKMRVRPRLVSQKSSLRPQQSQEHQSTVRSTPQLTLRECKQCSWYWDWLIKPFITIDSKSGCLSIKHYQLRVLIIKAHQDTVLINSWLIVGELGLDPVWGDVSVQATIYMLVCAVSDTMLSKCDTECLGERSCHSCCSLSSWVL